MKRLTAIVLAVFVVLALIAGCSSSNEKDVVTVSFADVGWDSVRLHNAIASVVAERVFGFETMEISGTTPITHEALLKGEIDVHMEIWTDNLTSYEQDVEAGKLKELGVNFDDNIQGLYVPRYVIEGDPQRGITPVAPDLKYVWDLKNYPELFPDVENPGKGRIYGALSGWGIDEIMYKKFLYYGLDQNFTYFRPGTDAAMSASLVSAYDKGEPIVAYYWEPTWLMGKYDFVLLEDAPYDPEGYPEGKTACQSVLITTGASNQFYEAQPEFCQFVANYKTSSGLISQALAYMQDNGVGYDETAVWLLTEGHPELVDQWLTPTQAETLRNSFAGIGEEQKINPFFEFPFVAKINTDAIDYAVRDFSVRNSDTLNAIKMTLIGLVTFLRTVLKIIPWWLFIGLVFLLGKGASKSYLKALIYASMLFLIGVFGLWNLMLETLSIVLAGVVISLLIGLPIGVLMSGSKTANKIMRPVLDTMQTMPVFVYLIPAVLFFGMGSAPAVIATVIYAVVPVIRLTSLGIQHVDKEVVEAGRSFGSTRWQLLIKVQIPQALPTIMTGVNQTMMMAMAMVVTCSMIGAQGIGNEVLIAVNRTEISRGIINGTAVVILAVLMDRLTQGWFGKGGDKK